jgi:hypothetical protein
VGVSVITSSFANTNTTPVTPTGPTECVTTPDPTENVDVDQDFMMAFQVPFSKERIV